MHPQYISYCYAIITIEPDCYAIITIEPVAIINDSIMHIFALYV